MVRSTEVTLAFERECFDLDSGAMTMPNRFRQSCPEEADFHFAYNGGFDPDEYQGYAFGMGPDRMTMLRHGIGDIRLFFSADRRFISQFSAGH